MKQGQHGIPELKHLAECSSPHRHSQGRTLAILDILNAISQVSDQIKHQLNLLQVILIGLEESEL
jgi:hypothetical protein